MPGSALRSDPDTNKVVMDVGSRPNGVSPIDLERCKERPAGRLSDGQLEAGGIGSILKAEE